MHDACACPNHSDAGRERSRPGWISRLLALPLIALVRVYQFTLSPVLGRQCRFLPTCSWYALDALRLYGAFRGGVLAVRRLSRCHPLSRCGIDPVPERIANVRSPS